MSATSAAQNTVVVSGHVYSDPTHSGVYSGQGYSASYPTIYVKLISNSTKKLVAWTTITPGGDGAYSMTAAASGYGNYIVSTCPNHNDDQSCSSWGLGLPSGYWGAGQVYYLNAGVTGNLDFNLYPTTISGSVFDYTISGEYSASARWDGPTVYVKLLNKDGGYAGQVATITAANNTYTFSALPFGDYLVALASNGAADNSGLGEPDTWLPTYYNNYEAPVSLSSGNPNQSGSTFSFGLTRNVIKGHVFYDVNGNGSLDSGEKWSGLSTVYVKLLHTDGSYAGQTYVVRPGDSGDYSFYASAGNYLIALATNNGADNTGLGAPAGYSVISWRSTPASYTGATAGYYLPPGPDFPLVLGKAGYSIQGSVYYDANNDGALSGGESWSQSSTVYVKLLTASGAYAGQVATIAPNSTGAFSFGGLSAGAYQLALASNGSGDATGIGAPTGFVMTQPAASATLAATIANASLSGENFGLYSTPPNINLTKSVDKTQAFPGELITYTITYGNDATSTMPVGNMEIDDTVSNYTSYVGASCGALPAGLSACAASQSGGVVRWIFSGNLAPGASGSVTLQVRVK